MLPRLARADRKGLLLGTALASTLLMSSLLTPTPPRADATCPPGTFPPPGPIAIINPGDDISCVNVYDRSNAGYVIDLQTNAANKFINLNSSGTLTAFTVGGNARGISTHTGGATSPITIQNSGGINVNAFAAGIGIYADTDGAASSISIVNSGDRAALRALPTALRGKRPVPVLPSAS